MENAVQFDSETNISGISFSAKSAAAASNQSVLEPRVHLVFGLGRLIWFDWKRLFEKLIGN